MTELLGDYGWTPNEMRELDRYYTSSQRSAINAGSQFYQLVLLNAARLHSDVPAGWSDWYAHGHELH